MLNPDEMEKLRQRLENRHHGVDFEEFKHVRAGAEEVYGMRLTEGYAEGCWISAPRVIACLQFSFELPTQRGLKEFRPTYWSFAGRVAHARDEVRVAGDEGAPRF